MINVRIPDICNSEIEYILNVVLCEFLGLEFSIEKHNQEFIEISKFNLNAKIILDASFFWAAHTNWLESSSMPKLPLRVWKPQENSIKNRLLNSEIPILFGSPGLTYKNDNTYINIDIFGSAFFMLSRYEELITKNRDLHNRFPASASVAFKANFIDRPLINEYLEILKYSFDNAGFDLQFKKRKSENFITCDLDWPFDPALYSFSHAVKKAFRQVSRDIKPLCSIKSLLKYFLARLGIKFKDPYKESISYIMDVNEEAGNRVAFYFIMYNTHPSDSLKNFKIHEKKIQELFYEITSRGHEVGVHPGYETYNNALNFKKTIEEFNKVFLAQNIPQNEIGGRQHFLRWDVKSTPQLWSKNGLSYDSSLAFADYSGFRCGVCYEFTMYDLIKRETLTVKQKPLIVMECTIIADRYEGLGYCKAALERFKYFKNTCYKFNGTFTLLWHNSHFQTVKDKEFYKQLIS